MSDTVLKTIPINAGFNKNTTTYDAENNWVDGDKVRFVNNRAEKIGGWVEEIVEQNTDSSVTSFTGTPRKVHTWNNLNFNKYLAQGSDLKLELLSNNTIYDITPIEATASLTDAITTVSGETTVTIEDTSHGASVGDYVVVDSQASAVDSITLSGEYTILEIVDADNYVIDSGTTATGSTSGGGGALELSYLLPIGDTNNGDITGYSGAGYGTRSSDPVTTVTLTDAISTTSGSSTVGIEDTSHGLSVGDYITVVSQGSSVDGIDLSDNNDFTQDFEVTNVVDADNYEIKAINNVTLEEVTATGTTSGAGGSLVLVYGGTGWDRPRNGVGGSILRQWSLTNWGEDLIACVRGGKIYQWDVTNGTGNRAVQVTNAPTENYFAMVALPTRFLVAFGTQESVSGDFDPLTIRWAEQETLTNWTITSTNSAGEYRLPLGNYIVAAIQTKNEILVLTDTTAYTMRYVGGNEIFQFEIVGNNITAVSQNCGTAFGSVAIWKGLDGFYIYDGTVRRLPSTIEEFIFDQDGEGRINFEQKEKTYCNTNTEFNEIIWFYPTVDSEENNRYIMYNFKDNIWYDGTMERTCWVDRSVFSNPYAFDADGTLYLHETGKDAGAQPLQAFLESGDLDIEEGERMLFIDKFIPDFFLVPNRNAEVTLTFKKYPRGPEFVKGPYPFNNDTQKISLRGRGRHVSIKYSVNTLGSDFELGAPRFSFQVDGER